jgi:protein CpxP
LSGRSVRQKYEREFNMMMIGFRRIAIRLGALAVCGAALSTMPMLAQGGGGGQRGGMSPEAQQAQLDAMTKAVGLTDDQVAKVKALNADSMKKMMALRDSGGDPQDMRPKMMEIRTAQQTQIKALLTDDQKPKYDAYIASQRPIGGGRGPGGGGPPPPPPPPPPPL